MTPSTTPSNSRRRNSSMPRTKMPLVASSKMGALITAPTNSAPSLPRSPIAISPLMVLIQPENPQAVMAPQRKAMASAHQGSGS
jgi:hypothetical protein